ncbi:MAG: MFS transporter [Gammaproteobacteria bacterium]|nr:MFS transporter [Gammaproteobacteria bacterium]MCY4281737.1 MFS transporter [Gammaproteobacteria bacterium]MCY4339535.1 MFS transporter [Gammaproteobacteria bacterium]
MKIFYGWWVLLGLFLIYAANNGILMYTLPLFYPELIDEFGWSSAEVTRPAALFYVVAAVLTPFIGALFDRYSTRLIMLLGIVALIAALCFYPAITSLHQLTAIYIVFALGLAACGLVPNMLILTRWFKRNRGLAMGLLLTGSTVGGAVFPLVARETLITQGWRQAVLMIAILGSVMMVGAVLLLVRNRPQELGLNVDGDASPAEAEHAAVTVSAGPTLRQAVQMPVFYILAFVTGALWFATVSMLQHQSIFIGKDLGVDAARLPLIFSLFFWCAIIGKLLLGWLSDKLNKLWVMFSTVLSLILGLALLRLVSADNIFMLYAYAVVFGMGFGGTFSMIQQVLADYFAGASYGKILALMTAIDSLAGAAGIRYLGAVRDAQGSYLSAFDLLIILCAVSAVLIVVLIHRSRNAILA